MTLAFVDSSAWIAVLMPTETHHAAARAFFRNLTGETRLVTSNLVLSETFTWLRYKSGLPLAVRFQNTVSAARRIGQLTVVWTTEGMDASAWTMFEGYADQAFSFCDCVSAIIARAQKVDYFFAFGSDFITMGFDMRPRAS